MTAENPDEKKPNVLDSVRVIDVLTRQIITPYMQHIDRVFERVYRDVFQPYEEISRRLLEPYTRFISNLSKNPALEAFAQAIREIVNLPPLIHPKAQTAREMGWIIHHTLPVGLLDDTDEEFLDDAIMTYYQAQWEDVRKGIEENTAGYLIGEESKELVNQALEAHYRQLYRLVPRSLLPEIEAVIRKDLSGKSIGRVDIGMEIEKLAEVPAPYLQSLSSALIEFEALQEHLYVNIYDDAKRAQFADSEVPNRHAAIHGIIAYASEKSSLNCIFLTDFVLQMITAMKKIRIVAVIEILNDRALLLEQQRLAAEANDNRTPTLMHPG